MADVHFFDARIAKLYGVNCAVILQNIWHWIRKNEANGVNFYDGDTWTYNSTKAFSALFPYLSAKQIETALKKLREEGIIKTGNYNAVKYDRTLWYAVTEKGKSILLTGEMEIPTEANRIPPDGEPIPDINTDRNADHKPYKDIVSYLNEKAGKRYKPTSKKIQSLINARMNEGFTLEDFKAVIDIKCAQWLHDAKMSEYLRPSTLFGTKFEEYLNSGNGKEAGSRGINQNARPGVGERIGTYL